MGGLGLNCVEYALVGEELGKSPLGHYVVNGQAPDAGNMEILREFGTEAQQERWLCPLVRGEIRSCFAMTEPDHAGSNPVWMGTTAVRDGDHYVINGRKWFASAADGASFAIVMAVTDPNADPYRRASLIVVPTDTPGFAGCATSPAWDTPATTGPATPSWYSMNAAFRVKTCSARRGAGSRWPRPGWARDESSTRCAGLAFAAARSR